MKIVRKLVDCQMIKSKYFCLETIVVKINKISVKAIENCVESLMAKGINAASIVVLTPTVTLDTVHLQSPRIDCACQVDVLSSCSENWLEILLERIDVTEAELDAILTESEKDNLLSDQIDFIVHAIKTIRLGWPQCSILILQNQLQASGLKTDVLEPNPLIFEVFKQKLYKEFQSSFFWYCPLFQYVTIRNLQCQVMWLWEFLVNTPIDENTYKWLQILINV